MINDRIFTAAQSWLYSPGQSRGPESSMIELSSRRKIMSIAPRLIVPMGVVAALSLVIVMQVGVTRLLLEDLS